MPTTFGCTFLTTSAISAVEKISPNGRSMIVTCAPARPATSAMRPPKTPLTQTTILSPGSIKLTTHVSIPALPVPLTASVSSLVVRKTCRSIACISVMICKKYGSRCPTVGAASAAQTRG